ncbi:MAG TPA: response regulator [Methanomicrobiales archaeon]|nr:response regulator [Methanomicrobiales archaeon]
MVILLIDDSATDARLTAEALCDAPVPNTLRVVPNVREAMVFLRRDGPYADVPLPDLILLDVHLHRSREAEFLQEIQSDDQLKQIPVVVLTEYIGRDEQAEIQQWPIRRHIVKPGDLETFVNRIQSLLNEFVSS